MMFQDRTAAGEALGELLARQPLPRPVVLGLPRGGIPVAAPVARRLGAPLDVLVVRKLGAPGYPELAMGAVGEGGASVRNDDVIASLRIAEGDLARAEARERAEVERRAVLFREGRAGLALTGRTAVLVDDGLATGASARAACRIARARGAGRIVLAVPVAPEGTSAGFPEADAVLCCEQPRGFQAVGRHYVDFAQVPDDEVIRLLRAARG